MANRSFSLLVLLAVLLLLFASPIATTRGEETDPYADFVVEIVWCSDITGAPVHRLKLVSERHAAEAKAWAEPTARRQVLIDDIPGLEDLIGDDEAMSKHFEAGYRHVAVLTSADCAALDEALKKMPQPERLAHFGYAARVDRDGTMTRRDLGSPAETCKFLREVNPSLSPDAAEGIEEFAAPVERWFASTRRATPPHPQAVSPPMKYVPQDDRS
jgi:hypothetical protein